jgi:hypothetical protein
MKNELLERELQNVPRPFTPPMPRTEAEKLKKREKLELCKPLYRDHQADQEEPFFRESHKTTYEERNTPFYENYEKRWSYLYGIIDGGQYRTSYLGQLRAEVKREDEYGHYRERAWGSISVIEGGWEVEVVFPIPITRTTRREHRRASWNSSGGSGGPRDSRPSRSSGSTSGSIACSPKASTTTTTDEHLQAHTTPAWTAARGLPLLPRPQRARAGHRLRVDLLVGSDA